MRAANYKNVSLFTKEAIKIPTVSFSETELNFTALREFSLFLRKGKHISALDCSQSAPPVNGALGTTHRSLQAVYDSHYAANEPVTR